MYPFQPVTYPTYIYPTVYSAPYNQVYNNYQGMYMQNQPMYTPSPYLQQAIPYQQWPQLCM